MAKEIEILVELKSDLAEAKKRLEQFTFKGVKETIDEYYYDPMRPGLGLNAQDRFDGCCRIREKNGQYTATYKVDHYDGDEWLYSDEYETEIKDNAAMDRIFRQLGLEPLVVVHNMKYTYEAGPYEIVLEDVKDLGAFLEVEFIGDTSSASVDDIKNGIRRFISDLGLETGEALNIGKPEMLLIKRRDGKKEK